MPVADRRRDPSQRQPGLLAGGGQADLLHVGLQERAGAVAGHQDAEVDQPLDLGLGHPGEVGKSRCRQPLHAAVILGAVWPAGEGRTRPRPGALSMRVTPIADWLREQGQFLSQR
jgi:hypothetical protein